ncbi:MAG: hypothetical protein KGZ63_04205 [Clostridiales bacterium]|nr:hypothetical protein [Clostridiales bacterium]
MRKFLKRIHGFSFGVGFLYAFLLMFSVLAMSAGYLTAKGVTVYLDSGEVARMVREQIVAQAQLDLPKLIAGAKSEIPRIVEEEMQDQLTSDRMEIAGFVFRVPDELMEQLKGNIQTNVENATGQILDGIDTQIVAEQFGEDVYRMVQETMHSELDGRSFEIMAFDRIPVNIHIRVLQ